MMRAPCSLCHSISDFDGHPKNTSQASSSFVNLLSICMSPSQLIYARHSTSLIDILHLNNVSVRNNKDTFFFHEETMSYHRIVRHRNNVLMRRISETCRIELDNNDAPGNRIDVCCDDYCVFLKQY